VQQLVTAKIKFTIQSIVISSVTTFFAPKIVAQQHLNGSILSFENKIYAFITLGNKQFEMKEVIGGNSANGFIEIIFEHLKGTTIVTKSAYLILRK